MKARLKNSRCGVSFPRLKSNLILLDLISVGLWNMIARLRKSNSNGGHHGNSILFFFCLLLFIGIVMATNFGLINWKVWIGYASVITVSDHVSWQMKWVLVSKKEQTEKRTQGADGLIVFSNRQNCTICGTLEWHLPYSRDQGSIPYCGSFIE
jgi:hypothetical protein